MNLWSVSFSYRLGLAFHALNNEGADGGNLMQPRRIDVGGVTYDGISGEIVRRHILQNFVELCRHREPRIPIYPFSEGLHPDRGPIGIRRAAKILNRGSLQADVLYLSVRQAIGDCAVLDVGGYLAAWQDVGKQKYVAEKEYIDSFCAALGADLQPIKRDSCFDVAWLISEEPQDLTVTQHSAFRDSATLNSRYAQTMRSNVYAGVVRAELHRVGTDDYWYLQKGEKAKLVERLAVEKKEQVRRQGALIEAIGGFIAAPVGAKMAGWAPHVFLCEGVVLLTSTRTAPFESPIRVELTSPDKPVRSNPAYRKATEAVANNKDAWAWPFDGAADLIRKLPEVVGYLEGKPGGRNGGTAQS